MSGDITATARDNAGHPPPTATYRPAIYMPMGRTARIVFRAVRGDIWQIERDTLNATNLRATAVASSHAGGVAPTAVGSPTAIFVDVPHVFYRTVGGTIIDLFGDANNLRWRKVCIDAAADPTAFVDSFGHAAVSFRAIDGTIRVARFVNGAWRCENATRPQGGGSGGSAQGGKQEGFVSDLLQLDESITLQNLVEDSPKKTFSPEDLASDMVGLDFVLISAFKTSRGPSFAGGSTVRITAWDNAKEVIEGIIDGSAVSIPKELLAPKVEMYRVTYTSRHTQREESIPLYVTDASSLRATIVDGKAKGKDQSNNYKQLNKHLLIEMQLNRFDNYLGAYTSQYNAVIGEPNGWAPLAPGWVKSMMLQESTAGSSGVYLVEVPGVPMKTRFNVLQAIDSWGPQQFLMI